MAQGRRNSAKWPILNAIVVISHSGAFPATSQDVLGFLEGEGIHSRPEAVRMALMRYAKSGIISREKDEDAPPYSPAYRYWPNARTYSTLGFLRSVKREGAKAVKGGTDGILDRLSRLATLEGSDSLDEFLAYLKEETQANRLFNVFVVGWLLNKLWQTQNELRRFQIFTLTMSSMKNNPRDAAQTSDADSTRFPVTYREPMYFNGERVTFPDGRKAYRYTSTNASWVGGELVFSRPPSNAEEAEFWNGADWQPLKPIQGAVTHGLVLEPVLDANGMIQYDELGLPKCRRGLVRYIYDGERWKPDSMEQDQGSRKETSHREGTEELLGHVDLESFLGTPGGRDWVESQRRIMNDRSYAKEAMRKIREEAPELLRYVSTGRRLVRTKPKPMVNRPWSSPSRPARRTSPPL
jgi:hypothetical protein